MVSDKVRCRLALIRLEFRYLRHIATVAHLWDAYRVWPGCDSRERLLEAVDAWNAFLATLFTWDKDAGHWRPGMRREVIPGWPEHRPFLGHSRHAVALTRDRHAAAYENTPLNWDPAAMRRAPLPGALR